jgi:hypothetical protein
MAALILKVTTISKGKPLIKRRHDIAVDAVLRRFHSPRDTGYARGAAGGYAHNDMMAMLINQYSSAVGVNIDIKKWSLLLSIQPFFDLGRASQP